MAALKHINSMTQCVAFFISLFIHFCIEGSTIMTKTICLSKALAKYNGVVQLRIQVSSLSHVSNA